MENNPEFYAFLKSNPIFQGLDDDQMCLLIKEIELKKFNANEVIFEEFEKSNYLCFLYQGETEVIKWDTEKNSQFKIKNLQAGDLFGEMAFLDEQERSATIKTIKDSTLFIIRKEIFHNASTQLLVIYNQILENISKIFVPRLRSTDAAYVQSLQAQTKQLRLSNQFGQFFIAIIIVFGAGNIFDNLLSQNLLQNGFLYRWSALIIYLLPFLVLVRLFNFSLQEAGVTLKNWKKSLVEGILISSVLILIFFLSHNTILTGILGPRKPNHQFEIGALVLYFTHSYIQEFIARGMIQSVLQSFYNDTKGIKSVFVTSMIFAIFHLHYGFTTAITIFIFSILFGFIYIRTHNLIGVTLVHFTLGELGGWLGLFE